jgi:hypothetical protein
MKVQYIENSARAIRTVCIRNAEPAGFCADWKNSALT